MLSHCLSVWKNGIFQPVKNSVGGECRLVAKRKFSVERGTGLDTSVLVFCSISILNIFVGIKVKEKLFLQCDSDRVIYRLIKHLRHPLQFLFLSEHYQFIKYECGILLNSVLFLKTTLSLQ